MILTPRLACIASLVPQGARLADIGTDHGKLPLSLLLAGKISSAIGSDIGEGPLAHAARNAQEHGVSLSLRLAAGLDAVQQNEIFFKELFSDLTEREKQIVCENLVEGKSLGEVADSLKICYRQASRDKKSALRKMLRRMKAAGYRSYAEAEKELLNNGGFAPTQMDAQNSIQRKRTGAVRLPSDIVKRK